MLRRLAALAAAATTTAALALAGCETEIIIDDGNPTGSGSTTSGTSSTGSNTTTGSVCDDYSDSEGPSAVVVTITNQSPFPIFLPAGCTSEPVLDIDPLEGPDGNAYGYDESCLQTCADLQQHPQYACGACAPASILLPPGTSRQLTWKGTALTPPRDMPATCWNVPQQAGTCVTEIGAPAQAYRFNVQGFADCGAGDCACTSEGLCSGDPSGQEAFSNVAKISYPEDGKVEILFDACAFGCAEPF